MLVLGRKVTQVVVLRNRITGEEIRVTVVRSETIVRLGFKASSDWLILREELDEE